MGKKKMSHFLFCPPSLTEVSGLGSRTPGATHKELKQGPEKGRMSHMVPSALSNLNFPRAHHITWILCTQVFDLYFKDLLKAKDRVPSNLQHRSEKTCWLHDLFISYNQPLQCPPVYFHTKNHRNNPLHSSWFLKQCVWVFSHLQQVTEISKIYLKNCLLQVLWVYNIKWRDFR